MEQVCCVQIECILVLKIDYWGNVVSDHKEELEGEGGGGGYTGTACVIHIVYKRGWNQRL